MIDTHSHSVTGPTAVLGRSAPSVGRAYSPESGPTMVLRRKPLGSVPPVVTQEIFEARLLAIFDSPITSIETPTQGFDRKERALGNAFAELTKKAPKRRRRR